jgi:SNF2 family DNA or RNA helicase
MQTGVIKKVLIVAPLSTLTPVWEKELFEILPRRKVRVLHGERAKRIKLLNEDADFYIVNHHGLPLLQSELVAKKFDLVIFDELAVLRNKKTELCKAANFIINGDKKFKRRVRAWGLTGSPRPNAPTDAWAQIKLLTPENATPTMAQFQDMTMRKVSDFRWVERPEANDIVYAAMQPSVRFSLDQVMELPETVEVTRELALSPDQKRAYKMLVDKMRTTTHDGQSVTAANEGVLQNKLLQVACGYIYTDKMGVVEIPGDGRKQALVELMEEWGGRVIVFVPFTHALGGVAEYLRSEHYNVGVVDGSVPRTQRDAVFNQFQDPTSPIDVIVAHPQCMAHGLTLTQGSAIIWYGPTQSLEIYEQANARIKRPGQMKRTMIAHLCATAVERATYRRLTARAKMQGLLLAMFQQQELEF